MCDETFTCLFSRFPVSGLDHVICRDKPRNMSDVRHGGNKRDDAVCIMFKLHVGVWMCIGIAHSFHTVIAMASQR